MKKTEEHKKKLSNSLISFYRNGGQHGFRGKKHSEETKKKISNKLRGRVELKTKLSEKNPMWKGNNVSITALHEWIRRRKPKPEKCIKCNERSAYDLANISQEYKRDINDFEWLCRRCHMLKDGRMKNMDRTGRKMPEKVKQMLLKIVTGRIVSQETRDKLSRAHKGKVFSPETLKKMSDAQKRRHKKN